MSGDFRRKELVEFIDEAYSLSKILNSEQPGIRYEEESSGIPADKRSIADRFLSLMNLIDELFAEVKSESGFQNLPAESIRIFREQLIPARDSINGLIEPDSISFGPIEPNSANESVSDLFEEVFALIDDGDSPFTADQIQLIQKVLFLGLFDPDLWLSNLGEIDPVLGRDADRRLPGSVRIRIQEIYRSHIAGNYLAAIALARATLEYAIVDCASRIGIDPYNNGNNQSNRVRPIGQLIAETGEHLPKISEAMETIVQAGNQTLHPQRKERLVLHPAFIRDMSKHSTNAIQAVTEYLYLKIGSS